MVSEIEIYYISIYSYGPYGPRAQTIKEFALSINILPRFSLGIALTPSDILGWTMESWARHRLSELDPLKA